MVEDRIEPFGAAGAVERRIRADGMFGIGAPAVWVGGPISTALASVFGVRNRPLGAILADPDLSGQIALLVADQISAAHAEELRKFAIARATINIHGDPPPSIAVVARGIQEMPAGSSWTSRSLVDAIDPLDTTIFASGVVEGTSWIVKRLKVSVAVEVGAWDLNLVSEIATANAPNAARPDLWADLWERGHGITNDRPTWQNGHGCQWGDEFVPHSAWLAKNDRRRLIKRVWTGQVAALLPWIEQYRMRIADGYQSVLKLGVDGSQFRSSIEDLDWGPIVYAIKKAASDSQVLGVAVALRDVRNELAHGRPVLWETVKTAFDAAERFEKHIRALAPG